MKKYNAIISSDIGTFIINRNDIGVGWQLSEYGTYDAPELQLISHCLSLLRDARENLVALDVGANIGVHSVIFSKEVGPKGKVYAFEAQRIVFNMLAGNMALNSIGNVHCFHNAVSDKAGSIDIPQYDYGQRMSFGSVEFGGTQVEDLDQKPGQDSETQEVVAAITIDGLNLKQLDFLKIDVEGMEMNVLQGAEKTIATFKPMIHLEYFKSDSEALKSWLFAAGYRLYTGINANYLCIPQEFGLAIGGLNEVV